MEKYFCTPNNEFNFFQLVDGKVDFWFTPDTKELCESVDILWYTPEEMQPICHEGYWGFSSPFLDALGKKSRKSGTDVFIESFRRPDKTVEARITLNNEKQFIAVGKYESEAYEKAARIAVYYA